MPSFKARARTVLHEQITFSFSKMIRNLKMVIYCLKIHTFFIHEHWTKRNFELKIGFSILLDFKLGRISFETTNLIIFLIP